MTAFAKDPYTPKPPRGKLIRLGVDLDGTLAEPVWTAENPTSAIGEPIWENVDKAVRAAAQGAKIYVHTARPDTDYENIEGWLEHHGIPFHGIRPGKPLFKAYVDDRAVPADAPDWSRPYSHRETVYAVLKAVLSEVEAFGWKEAQLRKAVQRAGLL